MSDHTPGPWQIVNRGDFETTIGVPKEDTSCTYLAVAEVESNHTEADARLIAAAPEMLEACKLCRDIVSSNMVDNPTIEGKNLLQKLTEAITKAEGDRE